MGCPSDESSNPSDGKRARMDRIERMKKKKEERKTMVITTTKDESAERERMRGNEE